MQEDLTIDLSSEFVWSGNTVTIPMIINLEDFGLGIFASISRWVTWLIFTIMLAYKTRPLIGA